MRDTAVIIVPRKLGDRQAAGIVDDGGFGTGTAEWRAFVQQDIQVFRGFGAGQYRIGGVDERRQAGQGRCAVAADVVVEGLFSFPAVPDAPILV